MNSIVNAILNNEKMMTKINNAGRKFREQARCYVISEAKNQKIRLSEEEIRKSVAMLIRFR